MGEGAILGSWLLEDLAREKRSGMRANLHKASLSLQKVLWVQVKNLGFIFSFPSHPTHPAPPYADLVYMAA